MSATMSLKHPMLVAARAFRVCAYCAAPATYSVSALDDDGTEIGRGYCCDEPTHWTWLLDDVEQLEREA